METKHVSRFSPINLIIISLFYFKCNINHEPLIIPENNQLDKVEVQVRKFLNQLLLEKTIQLLTNKQILKVGAIPDQNQDVLDKRFNLFSKVLSKELNVKVRYVPVINYDSAVT